MNGNNASHHEDIKVPKPFPRRKSLKKNQKEKKRSLSEEKERSGTLKESKKTSSSVDVLRQTSFEEEEVDNNLAALEEDGDVSTSNGD